eukprot:TRINITY_DN22961_c0_g1_i12.p1 TRINITY_DN22961_c0_g1~~TRINITY_DN22961_c0_g1_i12.p1  ORF type:complete len:477 (-),score=39.20 TRINITY_DN22961_c0_g1_i12:1533-2756(-)
MGDESQPKHVVQMEVAYLGVRMVMWLLLWLFVGFVACFNRKFRGTGWQLFRLLFLALTLQFIADAVLLGYDDAKQNEWNNRLTGILGAHIFFAALSQSVFFMVMLLISSGFGITRKHLTGLHCQIFLLPLIFFTVCLMMNYTFLRFQGREFFDVNSSSQELKDLNNTEKVISFFTFVVYLFSMVLIWIYILDLAAKEIGFLTGEISELEDSGERGPRRGPQGYVNNGQNGASQPVDVEQDGNRLQGIGPTPIRSDPLEALDSVVPANLRQQEQQPSPAENQSIQVKVRLLRRFSRAAAVYVVFNACLLVLPMFIPSSGFVAFMVVTCNLVLWFVYIWLVILFRPRKDSPYLLLTEEEELGNINNGANGGEIDMGVMGNSTVQKRTNASSVGPKFSLAEEEDDKKNIV